jgi:hypothetical protein
MYTLNRSRGVNPAHTTDAIEWAAAVAARVREVTGKHIDAWVRVMSPDAGTLSWSCWDETLRNIEAIVEVLDTEGGVAKLTASMETALVGPIKDCVFANLHGHHTWVQGEHGKSYVLFVHATIESGRFAQALVSGKRIAEYASSATGRNTAFMLNFTGAYNGVRWATGYPDIDSVDQSERILMDDPEWHALLSSAGIDFRPAKERMLQRRLT